MTVEVAMARSLERRFMGDLPMRRCGADAWTAGSTVPGVIGGAFFCGGRGTEG